MRGLLPGLRLAALPICLIVTGLVATHQPQAASAAASQDWPPFVLVVGLLLVGALAQADGLFAAAGRWLGAVSDRSTIVFLGAVALIALVTALLNLDTSVAFLTPVLLHAARSRGDDEEPFLYGSLLLANAASLPLPGSNLTNLIVLGQLRLSGHEVLSRMAAPFVASVAVTAAVIGVAYRRSLGARSEPFSSGSPAVLGGVGAVSVLATVVVILFLPDPALPVLGIGLCGTLVRALTTRSHPGRILHKLGLPTLIYLFTFAIVCGTVGRVWDIAGSVLPALNRWETAFLAAAASVLFNNLPAASLLSAGTPHHPFALLIGLNVGPNLFCTGSLAWVLWYRTARAAGAAPSLRSASRLGILSAPLAIAAAVAVLS